MINRLIFVIALRRLLWRLTILSVLTSGCAAPEPAAVDKRSGLPPVADKQPKTITVHGDSRIDNYFWLREQTNPKVIEYLNAEDAYANGVMTPTSSLQDALFKEMVGHIKETDDTVPYRRGDYFYHKAPAGVS